MSKIFILVKVSYDYYRYQHNVFASCNKEDIFDAYTKLNSNLPLLEYTTSDEIYDALEGPGENDGYPHYWIQEL